MFAPIVCMHDCKYFTYIIDSFNPIEKALSMALLLQVRKLSSWPKVTQLVNGGAGAGTLAVGLLPSARHRVFAHCQPLCFRRAEWCLSPSVVFLTSSTVYCLAHSRCLLNIQLPFRQLVAWRAVTLSITRSTEVKPVMGRPDPGTRVFHLVAPPRVDWWVTVSKALRGSRALHPSTAVWPSSSGKGLSVSIFASSSSKWQCASTEAKCHWFYSSDFQWELSRPRVIFYSEPLSRCLWGKWVGVWGLYWGRTLMICSVP